jgi:hypothetical protein
MQEPGILPARGSPRIAYLIITGKLPDRYGEDRNIGLANTKPFILYL